MLRFQMGIQEYERNTMISREDYKCNYVTSINISAISTSLGQSLRKINK